MDIISTPPKLVLNDPQWRIYSRNPIMPPHYVGMNASITQSLVTEGCRVEGKVHHTVLFDNVSIEPGRGGVRFRNLPGLGDRARGRRSTRRLWARTPESAKRRSSAGRCAMATMWITR